ncbi:MAG: VWA domain-containing protein [Acidobacteriota bacterium]
MTKIKSFLLFLGIGSIFLLMLATAPQPLAQDDASHLQVNVDLVQLNVAVTDRKGNYIAGLKPSDFAIAEDKIPEKISTFEEGGGRRYVNLDKAGAPDVQESSARAGDSAADAGSIEAVPGTSVFILFDTSNYMYRGFVYAQDAIADFIRSLDPATRVAFYSYSRNLSRATPLTSDRFRLVNGVRSTVAGDDAALYNSLLLTVKDASQYTGRKVIVVFSNGPDNASSVPPEDVAELAQSTGTIIYIVSTRQANIEPVSTAAFTRVSKATGGKAYFASSWRDERQAFAAIREDIAHLYTISYYPAPNPNRGWRVITVKLVGKDLQKYHIRTRDGYRLLQPTAITNVSYAPPASPIPAR